MSYKLISAGLDNSSCNFASLKATYLSCLLASIPSISSRYLSVILDKLGSGITNNKY